MLILDPLTAPPVRTRQRAPMQLLWHLREVKASGTGSYRISVPLSGATPSPDLALRVQLILEQMWVHYPTSSLSAAAAVSVAIGPDAEAIDGDGDRSRLVVILSVDPTRTAQRIDGTQMARHLRSALEQAAASA